MTLALRSFTARIGYDRRSRESLSGTEESEVADQ